MGLYHLFKLLIFSLSWSFLKPFFLSTQILTVVEALKFAKELATIMAWAISFTPYHLSSVYAQC
jgi:hypothetical protein